MAKVPYLNSESLVEAVRRRASLPRAASMFSDEDILEFANDEIQEHIVPMIKSTHEEYFVWIMEEPLVSGQSSYPVPSRAVGNALRDFSYVDTNGNEFEMSRIQRDDRYNSQFPSTNSHPYRFYMENANVVLRPGVTESATGFLQFAILLRPNQLVKSDQVSRVTSIDTTTGEVVTDNIPADVTVPTALDFLVTKSPHNFLAVDVFSTSINYVTNTFTFDISDEKVLAYLNKLSVGDTISKANETDIPGLPTELHRLLVTRTVERILESLGDTQALGMARGHSKESELNATKMIDNRVTSAPLKVKNNHGLLRKKFQRNRKF